MHKTTDGNRSFRWSGNGMSSQHGATEGGESRRKFGENKASRCKNSISRDGRSNRGTIGNNINNNTTIDNTILIISGLLNHNCGDFNIGSIVLGVWAISIWRCFKIVLGDERTWLKIVSIRYDTYAFSKHNASFLHHALDSPVRFY